MPPSLLLAHTSLSHLSSNWSPHFFFFSLEVFLHTETNKGHPLSTKGRLHGTSAQNFLLAAHLTHKVLTMVQRFLCFLLSCLFYSSHPRLLTIPFCCPPSSREPQDLYTCCSYHLECLPLRYVPSSLPSVQILPHLFRGLIWTTFPLFCLVFLHIHSFSLCILLLSVFSH